MICDSINSNNVRMRTFEIEYPRFILAEVNTHRMLSKNSASSRAIPTAKMISHIEENMAMPVYWGKNQPGMQAAEEVDEETKLSAIACWKDACAEAAVFANKLNSYGLHKQVVNRVTEPWMTMKTVISGTEWANFYHLRRDKDAQPEFKALADAMFDAETASTPVLLKHGEWHLPYVRSKHNEEGVLEYFDSDDQLVPLEDARIISAACCAQVSYRTLDDTFEKCQSIYKRLIESSPRHCFIDGTEVLTKSGFKLFKEILPNDLVANIDQESLQFTGWVTPTSIISRELQSDETIYYYPSIELGVTNNHKMLGSIVSSSRTRQVYTHSIFRPGDSTTVRCKKRTQGEREALLPKTCNMPDTIDFEAFTLGQLIGVYIGDGFYVGKTIHFRLVKDRKIKYLSKLLTSLDIPFNITKRDCDLTSVGNQVYEIDFTYEFDLGSECGKGSLNKKIPVIAYNDMSILSGVFDGLKNSDGSVKRKTWVYSTTSELLKEQMVALAPLVGLSISENKMDNKGCFKLGVATRNYIRINDSRQPDYNNVRIYHSKQYVYCVEVPGGALVIRTPGGQTMVSGNCSPVEHQATPIDRFVSDAGVTHMDRKQNLWSGNLRDWVQFRKLIDNEAVYG